MAQAVDRRKAEKKDELVDKLVYINRVAKTVKGGRNMSFAAVVVVGDQKGRVGYGSGKATEVPDAIVKATNEAKKNMVRIPLREGRTLHHDVHGRFGAGKVILRTAPAGTGVIAGGPMRAIFEVLGVQDVVAKSLGSNNPYNMIKATFNALEAINGYLEKVIVRKKDGEEQLQVLPAYPLIHQREKRRKIISCPHDLIDSILYEDHVLRYRPDVPLDTGDVQRERIAAIFFMGKKLQLVESILK